MTACDNCGAPIERDDSGWWHSATKRRRCWVFAWDVASPPPDLFGGAA